MYLASQANDCGEHLCSFSRPSCRLSWPGSIANIEKASLAIIRSAGFQPASLAKQGFAGRQDAGALNLA